jgi:Zn-dependent peptidase ImmA (M78 family)
LRHDNATRTSDSGRQSDKCVNDKIVITTQMIGRMADFLQLSPQVLEWAANQTGGSLGEIARKISTRTAERIIDGKLSHPQAEKFAQLTGTPFGYLFLDAPPESRKFPIADFRTLPRVTRLSKNFFDVYDDIDYKQAWYRAFLEESGAEPLPFIGRFSLNTDPATVANDIRLVLKFSVEDLAGLRTPEDLFSLLSSKAEAVGILVFKNGVVIDNTKRSLAVDEFRGFVLSDPLAPAVFINGSDAPAAWAFTLAHELAHLWLGHSGVSDAAPKSGNRAERLCNAIAAELLVPRAQFLTVWNDERGHEDTRLDKARKHFRVSALVIARRALDLGLISEVKYEAAYENAKRAAKRKKPGGSYYSNVAVRNSKRFTGRIAHLAASGAISLREAGQLLNMNPNNVLTYYAKQRALLA